MHEINTLLPIARAALTGALLGAAFFGGLWWTVRRAAASPCPALWFGPSLLLRTAMVIAGFYWVGGASSQWPRLTACLAGFVLSRIVLLRMTRHWTEASEGVAHASES